MNGRLSITDVAKAVGVTPRTIMRWEKSGKIKRSKRDWRGWRFYQKEEVEDIKRFYESSYEYDQLERNVTPQADGALVSLVIGALVVSALVLWCAPARAATAVAKGVTETSSTVDIDLVNLPVVQTPPPTMAEAVKYTLGPNDVIDIEVRRHPEFSGQYVINSEGKIEYKFVGDIIVEGLNKTKLQERLTQILSEFVVEPEVNVQIVAYLSKVFYVVGEVGNPGKFYMKGNTINAREALVQSGLPTHAAAMRRCRLITPDSKGKNNYADINVYELLYGGDLKQNLEMKPGDVLYVPATIMAKIVRIISPVTTATAEAGGAAARGVGIAAMAL